MNNANYVELNNNLEYWYGFIDANLILYNRNYNGLQIGNRFNVANLLLALVDLSGI